MTEINLKDYLAYLDSILAQDSSADEVIHHCRHILQYYSKNVAAYRLLGQALYTAGQVEQAGEMFRRVLSVFPLDFVANVELGEIYAKIGRPDLAIWHTERAFDQNPANAEVIERLRGYYQEFRQTDVGRIPLTAGSVAQQHLRNGNYGAAAEAVLQALSRSRTRVDLLILLSEALWLDGKRVDAAEVAVEVLKTLPYSLQANRILTLLWLQERRPSDAQRYLNRIESVDPYLARELATGKPAPDDAFVMEELDYDRIAKQQLTSQRPDWLDTLDASADLSAAVAEATDEDLLELEVEDDFEADAPQDDSSLDWLNQVDHMREVAAEKTVAASLDEIMEVTDTDLNVDDLFDVDGNAADWLDNAAEQGSPRGEEKTGLTGLLEALDSDTSDDDDFLDDIDDDDFSADDDWLAEVDSTAATDDTSSKHTGLTGLLSSLDDDDEDEDDFLEDIDDIDVEEFLTQGDATTLDDVGMAVDDEDLFDAGEDDSLVWLNQSDVVEAEVEDAPTASRRDPNTLPGSDDADPMAWMKSSGVEYDEHAEAPIDGDPFGVEESSVIQASNDDPMAWAKKTGVELHGDDSPGAGLFDEDDFAEADDNPLAWMKSSGIDVIEDDAPAAPAPIVEAALPETDDDSLGWLDDDAALDEILSLEQLTGEDEGTSGWGAASVDEAEDWQPPQPDEFDMVEAEAELESMEWLDEDDELTLEDEASDEATAFAFEDSAESDEDEETPDWLDDEAEDETFAVEAPAAEVSLFDAINDGADDGLEDEDDEAFAVASATPEGGLFDDMDAETEDWLEDEDDEAFAIASATPEGGLFDDMDAETEDWLQEETADDENFSESFAGEAVAEASGLFDEMDEEADDWQEEDTGPSLAIRESDEQEAGDWLEDEAVSDEEWVSGDGFSPVATDAYALGTAAALQLHDEDTIGDNLSDDEWLDDATDTWEHTAITDEDLMETDSAYDESESDEVEWFDEPQQTGAVPSTSATSESQVIADLFGEDDSVVDYGTSEASTVRDGVEWFGDEDEPWLEAQSGDYAVEEDAEIIAGMFGDAETHLEAPAAEDSSWLDDDDQDDETDPSWMDRDTVFEASEDVLEDDEEVGTIPALATDEVEAFMSPGADRTPNMGDTGELFADYVEMMSEDEEENTPSWLTQDMMRETTAATDWQAEDVSAAQTEGEPMSEWLDSDDSFDWASEEGDDEAESADAMPHPSIASTGDTGELFGMDEDEEEAVLDWMSDEDELAVDAAVLPSTGDTGELTDIDGGSAFNWQADLEDIDMDEDAPDWLMDESLDEDEEDVPAAAVQSSPDWLTATGEIEIEEDDVDAPAWLSDVGGYNAADIEAEAESPAWLTQMSAEDEADEEDDLAFSKAATLAAVAEEADEDVPDWLVETELDEDEADEASAIPDWLTESADKHEDDMALEEDAPDWLTHAAPILEAETTEDDGFDWVDADEDDEEAEPVSEGFDWDVEDEDEADAPDWLTDAAATLGVDSADDDFDFEDDDEEAEPVSEGFDWDVEGEDEADALEADAVPMMKAAVTDDDFDFGDDDEEAEPVSEGFDWDVEDEDEADGLEADAPDWLADAAPMMKAAVTDDDFDFGDDDEEAEPVSEGFDWDVEDEDEADAPVAAEIPDWLNQLDVETDEAEAEPVSAANILSSTANQDVPDWLLEEDMDFGDEVDEPAAVIESVTDDIDDALDDEEIAPIAAGNAPDWLNAMVPGLDLDYEAEEDQPVEQSYMMDEGDHRRVPNAAGEFAWLLDIVDEETGGMTPVRSRRRYVFSQDPLWLRAPTPPPPNLPGTQVAAQTATADWLDDLDDDDWDDNGLVATDLDGNDLGDFDSLDDFEAFDEFDPDFLDDDDF